LKKTSGSEEASKAPVTAPSTSPERVGKAFDTFISNDQVSERGRYGGIELGTLLVLLKP
jgi:hypothetical protein